MRKRPRTETGSDTTTPLASAMIALLGGCSHSGFTASVDAYQRAEGDAEVSR